MKVRLRQYVLAAVIAFAMAGSVKTFALVMAVEVFIIEMPVLYRNGHSDNRDPGRRRVLNVKE